MLQKIKPYLKEVEGTEILNTWIEVNVSAKLMGEHTIHMFNDVAAGVKKSHH